MRTELIPKVEARYRADPARRILFGQAHSSHFVLYSAYDDPDLFWSRIAYIPSFEPSMARFYKALAPATCTDLRLVVASGTRDRTDIPWQLAMPDIQTGTHVYDTASVYRTGMRIIYRRAVNL